MTFNRELPGSCCCCCTCGYYISPLSLIYLPAGLFYSFYLFLFIFTRGEDEGKKFKVVGVKMSGRLHTRRELKNKSNIKETRGQARLLGSSVQGNGWSRMEKKNLFSILKRCWNAPGPFFYYYFPVDGWTPSDFEHFKLIPPLTSCGRWSC